MIGTKVANMILDDYQLAFYKYEGDVRQKLDAVRDELNAVAEEWTREQKDQQKDLLAGDTEIVQLLIRHSSDNHCMMQVIMIPSTVLLDLISSADCLGTLA